MNSANGVSAGSPKSRSTPSNLIQRTLSTIVLLPLLVFTVWVGGAWLVAVVLVCALAVLYELFHLFAHTGFAPRPIGYLCVALFVLAAASEMYLRLDLTGLALLSSILLTLGFELVQRKREGALIAWALTLSGATYIGWTFAHFILLRATTTSIIPGPLRVLRLDSGASWIMLGLLVTFASDTLAYFTGRAWGRHRLAPYISPSKSWEGALGGLLGAVLVGALLAPLLGLPITLWQGAVIGGIGSIAGQIGDLAESLLKRQAGIKDSGNLIPGHGGILDRADSLLFTIPVIYYLLHWLTA